MSFDFLTSSRIDSHSLAQFLSRELGRQVEVAGDTTNGQFPGRFNIVSWLPEPGIRQRVELLKRVAAAFQTRVLCDDEGHNPFLYILIEPDGFAVTVGVDPETLDSHDEYVVAGYHDAANGYFCTINKLDSDQRARWRELLAAETCKCDLEYWALSIANTRFNQYKKNHASLDRFEHLYFVRPAERVAWMSVSEKSEWLLVMVSRFHNATGLTLCAFPLNHSVIENIPGGSDSEEHCFLFEQGKSEKVIYKPRRKSW